MDYLYLAFIFAWLIAIFPPFRWMLNVPGVPIVVFGLCLISAIAFFMKFKFPTNRDKADRMQITEIEPEPEPESDDLPSIKMFKTNKKLDGKKSDDRGPKLVETLNRIISPGFLLIRTSEGPSITQFLVKIPPDAIDKADRISTKSSGIMMSMAAENCSLRLDPENQALIVELPRAKNNRYPVLVSDILNYKADAPLEVALGKTVTGSNYKIDLAKAPHLLIAGQTGGGKSVLLNTILTCLLMKRSPEELNLYMIDPKRVELSPYKGVPHLKAPIADNPEDAINLLNFIVNEMERRYTRLAETGTRNPG